MLEGTLTWMLTLKILDNDPQQSTMKRQKTSFPHKKFSYTREMKQSEVRGKRGEQTRKATIFSLLFTQSYDCQAQAIFLSVSASSPLSSSLLLVLSISVHDLAGAAEVRLNCAISYMFTLLASFWAYFPPNISPHIILHFLYNDMLSLISLCKPFLGPRIRIQ